MRLFKLGLLLISALFFASCAKGTVDTQSCFQSSATGQLVCVAGAGLTNADIDHDGVADAFLCTSGDFNGDGTADILDENVNEPDGDNNQCGVNEPNGQNNQGDFEDDRPGDPCECQNMEQQGMNDGDVDHDGTGDMADTDDDYDGAPDTTDTDQDGDGIPDETDPDDDNDGVPDLLDNI